MSDDHARVECPQCGYKSVPQWMNDNAHCLKCQAVVKTRPSCHESGKASLVNDTHRAPGEVSTHKYAPGSAMESDSGVCKKSPNGMHHFKFGKCTYCQEPEGHLKQAPSTQKKGGHDDKIECPECGYHCVPQWLNDKAHCLKCQAVIKTRDSKGHVKSANTAHRASGEVSTHKYAPGSAMESESGVCSKSPNGRHHFKFGKCSYCQEPEGKLDATYHKPGANDEKIECPQCGYRSVPQWLNDNAHCLKCQAIVKTRPGCHGKGTEKFVNETHRAPGEVSTHKYAPGSAMESESGECKLSPNGKHHWKFGKCMYCQQPEGQLKTGLGASANPGGHDLECPAGGKCVYKFAKCTKCGASEYVATTHSERRPSRDGTHGATAKSAPSRREPGEVSTMKYAPGSAMESESGECKKSPNGMHHWKFGKCTHCGQPEGRLATGPGNSTNPGGHDECSEGGKCMFKFTKCTKCGRSEFGHTSGATRGSARSIDKIKETFQRFDSDGNGVISLAELKAVLQSLPVPAGVRKFTEADFDKFLEAMDGNHDGVIDYNEFTDWLNHDSKNAALIMDNMKASSAGKASATAKVTPVPKRPETSPAPKSGMRGPERFFYDKSSYTGTHANGGPESVPMGMGSSYDQSWKRPG